MFPVPYPDKNKMLLSFFPIKETEKLSSEVDSIHFLSTWQIQVEICVCVYTHNFCVHLTGVDLSNLKEKKKQGIYHLPEDEM